MDRHFLLWASGPDKPGIVAAVTKILFDHGMNLEDSSMMRLGSEFGIFLIFASNGRGSSASLAASMRQLAVRKGLSIGIKKISRAEASAPRSVRSAYLVSVHGPDRPGIVYRVTATLARRKFNITDLSTHRTTSGARAGYILFIEGEITDASVSSLHRDLIRIQRTLKTKIDLRPVSTSAL